MFIIIHLILTYSYSTSFFKFLLLSNLGLYSIFGFVIFIGCVMRLIRFTSDQLDVDIHLCSKCLFRYSC